MKAPLPLKNTSKCRIIFANGIPACTILSKRSRGWHLEGLDQLLDDLGNEYYEQEHSATKAKLIVAALVAAICCTIAVITAPATYRVRFASDTAAQSDPEIAAVTTALHATGIASATVERADSNSSTGQSIIIPLSNTSESPVVDEPKTTDDCYYVMFAVDSSSTAEPVASSSSTDTVLAKIEPDGKVSIVSFERDVLPATTDGVEAPANQNIVEQAYTSGNRNDIKAALEKTGNIHIAYYASVDSRYLQELENNLNELAESGLEWQAQVEAKVEAERIAAEEAAKPKTVIDDNLWFNQNDYPNQYYQGYYDIASYGCGLCSTAMILDMLYGQNWSPPEVAARMEAYANEHGGIQYCVWAGTSYPQWKQVVEGEFGVEIRKAESPEDAKWALEQGKLVFAGNGGGVFKDANGNKHWHDGHIICFYKTDGSSVWAKDPAGCGGAHVEYTAEDFPQWWDWGGSNRMYIISRPGE